MVADDGATTGLDLLHRTDLHVLHDSGPYIGNESAVPLFTRRFDICILYRERERRCRYIEQGEPTQGHPYFAL